jgi:replication initiation and membrane attachment protein DnaB
LWWKTFFHIKFLIIKIFVKLGKDKVNTLSLVMHRVRFFKNLQKKSTLPFNKGWNSWNHQFPKFHFVIYFSWMPL